MEFKQQTKVAHKVLKGTRAQAAAAWGSSSVSSESESKEGQVERKVSHKICLKDHTKPMEIKLHTQQRAAKRAIFDHFVATKFYLIEQQKQQVQKLQKMIEDEEIRLMRKEMIPKAQLMPFFDRPFFPQRSEKPLTIPRAPMLHILSTKSWRRLCGHKVQNFQHMHAMKAI